MKPSLLYLKNYIQENYSSRNCSKSKNSFSCGQKKKINNKKVSIQPLFKVKMYNRWHNLNKKQYYFQVPAKLNSPKIKARTLQQLDVNEDPYLNKQQKQIAAQSLPKQKPKTNSSSVHTQNLHQHLSIQVSPTNQLQQQQQIKLNIIPPIQKPFSLYGPSSQFGSNEFQQFTEGKNNNIQSTSTNSLTDQNYLESKRHVDHVNVQCDAMKKIGYTSLSEYLEQMHKFQQTKKHEIKEAAYYPFSFIKSGKSDLQKYKDKVQRNNQSFYLKKAYFQKKIKIQENFDLKNIDPKSFNNQKSFMGTKKPQSRFSKALNNNNTTIRRQTHSSRSIPLSSNLFQYESIILVNCSNKKYFIHNLQSSFDYIQFLKYTTCLLQSNVNKENNYLVEQNKYGLFFCFLVNSKLKTRDCFFWIGKPIQYYKRDKVISQIDDFLLSVDGVKLIQAEKIWIIDYHGKNSYITKNNLKKCKEIKVKTSVPKSKPKVSKRISLAMLNQLSNLQSSENHSLEMGLLDFAETMFLKKQRNNVSTKGMFNLSTHQIQSNP